MQEFTKSGERGLDPLAEGRVSPSRNTTSQVLPAEFSRPRSDLIGVATQQSQNTWERRYVKPLRLGLLETRPSLTWVTMVNLVVLGQTLRACVFYVF